MTTAMLYPVGSKSKGKWILFWSLTEPFPYRIAADFPTSELCHLSSAKT